MTDQLTWGIIGTGGIATDFAQGVQGSSRCKVTNVCGTSEAKARAFAACWKLARHAASLEALLADPGIDAVYVASPHPFHEVQALQSIEAGKHVLCEKPLTLNAASAERVVGAARSKGVFLMEAFMYRCHPATKKLIDVLQSGAIGDIRHVRADFCFRVPRDPGGRLFNLQLGGGSILDVGGYPVSFSRLIAGVAAGKPFAEPTRVQASAVFGPTGADEFASALLTFASGVTASVSSATTVDAGTTAIVFGSKGKVVLGDPWIPRGQRQGLETDFTVYRDGHEPELVLVSTELPTYAIEAELVASCLPAQEAPWPAMGWSDTLGNMRVLDAWQSAIRG